MPIGQSKSPAAMVKAAFEGDYDIGSDVVAWAFVSDTYASIDVDAVSLTMSDLTVIPSSGNYVSGTPATGVTWVQTGNTVDMDCDDLSISADPANPSAVTCLVFYNDTSPGDDVMFVVDLTTDGTTPQTTVNGFTDTIAGLLSATVN